MKNLRKTAGIAMALVLVLVVGGCGTAYNPGTNYTTTGNAALGTGNAYVPGTTALTGTITGTGMNVGFNYGPTPTNRLGTNVYPGTYPRTGTNYGTGTAYPGTTGYYGTGMTGTRPGTTGYGTGMTGTHPGTTGYGTGMTGTHPGTTGYYGTGMTGTHPGTTGTTVGSVGTMRLKDGSYNASCDRRPNGSDDATVTIRGGRIEKVALRRFDGTGKEINYGTSAGVGSRTAHMNLKSHKDALARQIVSRQSVNTTPTGTAGDTSGWITAVKRALDKARL